MNSTFVFIADRDTHTDISFRERHTQTKKSDTQQQFQSCIIYNITYKHKHTNKHNNTHIENKMIENIRTNKREKVCVCSITRTVTNIALMLALLQMMITNENLFTSRLSHQTQPANPIINLFVHSNDCNHSIMLTSLLSRLLPGFGRGYTIYDVQHTMLSYYCEK